MMLDYEWGNPAAAAAAMLLFGDDTGQVDSGCHDRPQHQHPHPHQHQHPVFDHYGHGLGMDFFQQPQQISAAAAAAALFTTSTTSTTTSCHQQYGLALPPAPARIGLNLGVRTYFSSGSPEEEMAMVAGRVCRRRTRTARCQAEGCGADLTHAKHYHRRHKVCEFHSKASIVITAGLSQRFCQQCSRFHVLSEFDQGKRSCRKRLADHNRRRRKSQDLSPSAASNNASNNANNATATANNQPNPDQKKYPIAMAKLETCSTLTHVNSTQPPLLPEISPISPMALGLRCSAIPEAAGLSSSSSTGTSPPQSVPLLSQLGEFSHGSEHRFPSWDEAEDGASIRGVYQNK